MEIYPKYKLHPTEKNYLAKVCLGSIYFKVLHVCTVYRYVYIYPSDIQYVLPTVYQTCPGHSSPAIV